MTKNYQLKEDDFYKTSKTDVIVIGLILIIAMLSMVYSSIEGEKTQGEKYGIVFLENNMPEKVALDKDKIIAILDGRMQLEIKDGKIRVLNSDCPQKICLNSGLIKHAGQVIACVPNKVLIYIKTKKGSFLDAVVF